MGARVVNDIGELPAGEGARMDRQDEGSAGKQADRPEVFGRIIGKVRIESLGGRCRTSKDDDEGMTVGGARYCGRSSDPPLPGMFSTTNG